MKFRSIVVLLSLLLMIAAAGCVLTAKKPMPEFLKVAEKDMPPDVKIAAAAVFSRAAGVSIPEELKIAFDTPAEISAMQYPGFSIKKHRLFQYGKPPQSGADTRAAAGLLDLEDAAGRHAQLLYKVQYRLTDPGMQIEKSEIWPEYSSSPPVKVFVAPAASLEKEAEKYPKTWEGLFQLVNKHNILTAETNPAILKEKQTQVLCLFLMEQTEPAAGLRLMISERPLGAGEEGFDKDSKYLNFGGWRVAMIAGDFAARPESPFHITARLISDSGSPFGGSTSVIFDKDLGMLSAP